MSERVCTRLTGIKDVYVFLPENVPNLGLELQAELLKLQRRGQFPDELVKIE
jgi:hypothetical protein